MDKLTARISLRTTATMKAKIIRFSLKERRIVNWLGIEGFKLLLKKEKENVRTV